MGPLDRHLDALGVDPDAVLAPKVDTLRALVLVHVALRSWQVAALGELAGALRAGFVIAATTAAGLGLFACLSARAPAQRDRWGRIGASLAAAQLTVQALVCFPFVPNHLAIELLCCGLLAAYGASRDEDRRLLLTAVRWIAALVLLWSGIQKVWWGTWDHGEFLASAIVARESFATFMAPLLPPEELARLAAMDLSIGAGPFRLHGPIALGISNLTWILEIALPIAMLGARTRRAAVGGSAGLVALIEVAAREFFFGLLFVSLLLIVPPGHALRRAAPALGLLYVLLGLALLGLLPLGRFN